MADFLWHQLSVEDTLEKLESQRSGLSSEQAKVRLLTFGNNKLPSGRRVTLWQTILHQFKSPLIYVLLAAAIISLLLSEISDAAFIFLILLINAIVGTYQEWNAEAKASALQDLIKREVRVVRDGTPSKIGSESIVPGDVVVLEPGTKVPADIRLFEANNLTVEEAILTGESMAVNKNADAISTPHSLLAELHNMLFAGTTIATGRARGVVVGTGTNTEIGKIANSLRTLEMGKAPLVKRMEDFSARISVVVLVGCLLLGFIGYLNGIPLQELFFFLVAAAVSAIPEGLPIAMTVALSIGASRMAKRNVIIRRLTAVEGLGSCTFIATDKTGTLTVDQQTVKLIVLASNETYTLTGEGYSGEGQILHDNAVINSLDNHPQLAALIDALIICNEGNLERQDSGWRHAGDPVDIALLAVAWKAKKDPDSILVQLTREREVPFESARQYALTYYKRDGQLKVAVKGAIEKIVPCAVHVDDAWTTEAARYAANGYRIIAVGAADVAQMSHGDDIPSIEFLGFLALIDPLRPEARPAVKSCRDAGVEVAMITGDHPATALAIAREVGIAENADQQISGREIDLLWKKTPDEQTEILRTKKVFSRVSPHNKQRIVQALRDAGHFIAVTGDGVNDAPALKTANIGVSMGYGTDVAKDTASIIIRDNNFASLAAGIEEGRNTYANLRKIIYMLMSTGAAELMLIALALIFNTPLPFLPVQLLWLNLVTNGIQDISLAFEPGEKHLMRQPPRRPVDSIFDRLMIRETLLSAAAITLISFGLWYHLLHHLGRNEAEARNLTLLLMVLLQNFHTLNCRSETRSIFNIPPGNNKVLLLGILAAQGVHILAMHLPLTQNLLYLQPVAGHEWLKLFATASLIVLVMEVFKRFALPDTVRTPGKS